MSGVKVIAVRWYGEGRGGGERGKSMGWGWKYWKREMKGKNEILEVYRWWEKNQRSGGFGVGVWDIICGVHGVQLTRICVGFERGM